MEIVIYVPTIIGTLVYKPLAKVNMEFARVSPSFDNSWPDNN
jgi:hypothetical protein